MNHSTSDQSTEASYINLLRDRGFQSFLWTQFLGAFNDNVYKIIVSVIGLSLAKQGVGSAKYLSLASAVFVLPYLLFSGWAGQLADRFSKATVLKVTKAFEMLFMAAATLAITQQSMEAMLLVLFLVATQATFFGPAKYGILPEILPESQLSRANGLLELTTFIAIVAGTSVGAQLFQHWRLQPQRMGFTLIALAVIGSLCSLGITKTRPAAAAQPFRWNPFYEIWQGTQRLREQATMRWTVLGISYFWALGGLMMSALLLYGKETLQLSEADSTWLMTALAVGIGAGSVLAGVWSGSRIELGLVPWGCLLMGVFAVILALTSNFVLSLILLFAIGFGGGLFAVPLNAFLQERAAPTEKGRLMATNNFINMLGVILSAALLSLLHDQLGWSAAQIFLVVGLFTAISTAAVVWVMPLDTIRFVARCIGNLFFDIEIRNAHLVPETGPVLLIANHESYMDPIFLAMTTERQPHYLMKQTIYETWWGKKFFDVFGAIPISKKTLRAALERANGHLRDGDVVGIFPEGKLTLDGKMQAFERGYERVRGETNAPIIPVHISGMWGHYLSMKNGDLNEKPVKNLGRRKVILTVGEPILEDPGAGKLRDAVLHLGQKEFLDFRKDLVGPLH
jgi:acyl-[acyl-carrier-protein]-phospholipid O-acyltransferase / long-chain-fatty-acid--[acyl-carrier-protein] ligase